MSDKEKLEELENSLKRHDWHYRRSEMYSVIVKGRDSWNGIQLLMNELKELGYEDEVQELYLKYRPF